MRTESLKRWLFYLSYGVFVVLGVINALFFRSVYFFTYSCLVLLPSVFYIYDEYRASRKADALRARIDAQGIDAQVEVLSMEQTASWSDAGIPYYKAILAPGPSGISLSIPEFGWPSDMIYAAEQLKSVPVRYLPDTGDAIIDFDKISQAHIQDIN
ncbi:hypothetical protein [Advenella mimigardefordensis]|uniref:Putative membrane protein n=1 Tax=Advenella mimigardefordensis (strain DSM 17166 / LMG 22922 / DPN7) TaxID=1247726 RepID=W0PI26_ADVMD|nr:hypothetical protein [Advenella mimigardefordensis]AHG65442.1 putative membrane protein [Advenella mimigardefordensis DPN7]